MPTLNIVGNIKTQDAATWGADATVYTDQQILITSDVQYTGTDQNKFKIADGVGAWSTLDYMPIRLTVDVADLSTGTDGELITWDASGNPTTVAVGTAGQVLTSNGVGLPPTFQAVAGANYVAIPFSHTNGTAIADASDYFLFFNNTTLGATNNSSGRAPMIGGTVRAVYYNTYNASTFGSGESSTITLETADGAESNVIATDVLWNARNVYAAKVSGLDWVITAGLAWIKIDAATFVTNPASGKFSGLVIIEI